MLKTLMTAAVAAGMMAGSAFASTVPPLATPPDGFDKIFVESAGSRGGATGDIIDTSIGLIGSGKTIGLGGRIKNKADVWTFSTNQVFSVFFTDLGIDTNSGFDDTSIFGVNNGIKTAEFSLIDTSTDTVVDSVLLTSPLDAGTPLFGKTSAGMYSLVIDGTVDIQRNGSTYDLAITTIPVPAALPLLGAGVGLLGLMRRRSSV